MLSRLFRYAVTVAVLLAAMIAGLPLVVCVSEAHGMAIEVDRAHVGTGKTSADHAILFSKIGTAAQSLPCRDYRLEPGIFVNQIREKQPVAGIDDAGGGAPFLAAVDISLTLSENRPAPVLPRLFAGQLRTSLSDRRTIVLQI